MKKNQKVDYSEIAEDYDRLRTPSQETLTEWVELIRDFAGIRKDSRLLDVGCGTGRFTMPLAGLTAATTFGLDPSTEMLAKASDKDRHNSISWIRGKGEGLPFPDSSFNCVFMGFIIQHLTNREKAFKEAHRVLLPKGRLLIMTTSHKQFKRSPVHDFPKLREIDLRRFPSLTELKEMLRNIGFGRVSARSVTRAQRFLPVESLLEYVKDKPISTFALLSERGFKMGRNMRENSERNTEKEFRIGMSILLCLGRRLNSIAR